jgi:high-affinity iron transporter
VRKLHVALGFLSSFLLFVPALVAAEPVAASSLRQVAGVLDYVAGDYRGAVDPNGGVLDQSEYAEQRSLVRDADALAAQAAVPATAPLRLRLHELADALDAKRPPAQVAELCRAARAILVEQHGVVLAPATPPSRAVGARLYAQQGCVTCHGADGSANTEAAAKLDPRPANFLDPERMAAVSPHRAFFALTFGVQGTAMQPFRQLNDEQRWSLAFYVLSLRHAADVSEAGKQALAAVPNVPRDPGSLATLTEDELRERLAPIADPAARAAALAYLRAEAPFVQQSAQSAGSSLFAARAALQRGVASYRAGDHARARQELISAYLDGFEPHEAAIGARDRALVREVERAMLELRQAAANNASTSQVEQLAHEADALLSRAEHAGGGGSAA